MAHTHATSLHRDARPAPTVSWKVTFIGLLAIAFSLPITEHRAYLLDAGPYLLVIIASLFCMLGHRHHGRGHGHGGER